MPNIDTFNVGGTSYNLSGESLIAPIENTQTASQLYNIGDQFIYQGNLYTATQTIVQGGTITVGSNCQLSDDVTGQIKTINSNLSGKRIVTGYFSISVTANENKSITSSSDIISGTLPPDLYYTSYTFGGFSNSIPNNIRFCVDSNALKVRMDASNSSVGVNWICVY